MTRNAWDRGRDRNREVDSIPISPYIQNVGIVSHGYQDDDSGTYSGSGGVVMKNPIDWASYLIQESQYGAAGVATGSQFGSFVDARNLLNEWAQFANPAINWSHFHELQTREDLDEALEEIISGLPEIRFVRSSANLWRAFVWIPGGTTVWPVNQLYSNLPISMIDHGLALDEGLNFSLDTGDTRDIVNEIEIQYAYDRGTGKFDRTAKCDRTSSDDGYGNAWPVAPGSGSAAHSIAAWSQDTFGTKKADPIQLHGVHDPAIAVAIGCYHLWRRYRPPVRVTFQSTLSLADLVPGHIFRLANSLETIYGIHAPFWGASHELTYEDADWESIYWLCTYADATAGQEFRKRTIVAEWYPQSIGDEATEAPALGNVRNFWDAGTGLDEFWGLDDNLPGVTLSRVVAPWNANSYAVRLQSSDSDNPVGFWCSVTRNISTIAGGSETYSSPSARSYPVFISFEYRFDETSIIRDCQVMEWNGWGTNEPFIAYANLVRNTSNVLYIRKPSDGSVVCTGTTALQRLTKYVIQIEYRPVSSFDGPSTVKLYLNGVIEAQGTFVHSGGNVIGTNFMRFGTEQSREAIIDWYISNIVYAATQFSVPSGDTGVDGFGVSATSPYGIWRLPPTGNGPETGWTGDYTAVDEAPADTVDYIEASTIGQRDTFTFAQTVPAEIRAYRIVAIKVSATDLWTNFTRNLYLITKSNGIEISTYATQRVDPDTRVNYDHIQKVFQTDFGRSGIPWTWDNVLALEAGVGLAETSALARVSQFQITVLYQTGAGAGAGGVGVGLGGEESIPDEPGGELP